MSIDKDSNEVKKVFDESDFKISGWGCRHTQCLILFFTLTVAYSIRACMGVALVAMTANTFEIKTENSSLLVDSNSTSYNESVSKQFEAEGFLHLMMLTPPYPSFKWSKKVQDAVLASFFWGYMILQIPAGQLAHRFGARYLLIGALMINCVVSILLPQAAYYGGWVCTLLCRILLGLSQACVMPGCHTFFGKWTPLEERGRMAALTYGSQAVGPVLGLPITGFIAASPMGWPGIFRFYGILSGIMGVFLWWKAADTPAKHPSISAAERRYIEEGLGQKAGDAERKLAVPWSKILRSRGLYGIIFAHIGTTWGQVILYTEVPAFMNKVMGINIKANGLLSALPFLVMWITNFFFCWMYDIFVIRKYFSVTNCRKLANSVGAIPAAIGLLILAFVPKNIYVVEFILCVVCAFKISAHCGFQLNHIDISPNFAGTMMSISNFMSNLCGSLAPIVAGFILTDVTSEYLWRWVFCLAAAVYLITNTIYLFLGTAEVAEWNEPPKEAQDIEQTEAMIKTEKEKQ